MIREIKAIIRVDRLSDVVHALRQISGMPGVTVSLVHGYGRSHPDHPAAAEPIAETQLAKVETVVPAALVETVVNTIQRTAHRPVRRRKNLCDCRRARDANQQC